MYFLISSRILVLTASPLEQLLVLVPDVLVHTFPVLPELVQLLPLAQRVVKPVHALSSSEIAFPGECEPLPPSACLHRTPA